MDVVMFGPSDVICDTYRLFLITVVPGAVQDRPYLHSKCNAITAIQIKYRSFKVKIGSCSAVLYFILKNIGNFICWWLFWRSLKPCAFRMTKNYRLTTTWRLFNVTALLRATSVKLLNLSFTLAVFPPTALKSSFSIEVSVELFTE